MTERDRALGAFMGLPVGDSLGAPVEFKEPGEFVPVTDYRAGGAFSLPEGYWTDDTSMALCLADSIIAEGSISAFDLLERFSRWYKLGERSSTGRCFDIGNTTRRSLEAFLREGRPPQLDDDHFESGNGSIMRLSPVASRWWWDQSKAVTAARRQSLTTHGSSLCSAAAEELAALLCRAIRGESIHAELQGFAGSLDRVPNTGFVVHTMQAAKWAVGSTGTFEGAVLAAANLGGDADTIAAVAGQIAGAIYGLSGIRQDWVQRLHQSEELLGIATKLYEDGIQERDQ